MRKYLFFLKVSVTEFLIYRVRIILSLLDNFLNPLIIMLAILGAKPITGINQSALLPYYIGIGIFLPFLQVSIEQKIGDMTYSGEVNNLLVKPISFYKWLLFEELGRKIATLIVIMPIVIVLIGVAIFYQVIPMDLTIICLGLFVSVISFFLAFNLGYILGLLSFWLDEVWVLRNLREVLVTLLGGVAMPLYLFPKNLALLLKFTPFPYLVAWPSQVFRQGLLIPDLLIALTWLTLSFLLISFMWRRVLIRYSHVGG